MGVSVGIENCIVTEFMEGKALPAAFGFLVSKI